MSFLAGLRHRVRELARPAEMARELDEELEAHYEQEKQRQIERGVHPELADRAAQIRAGRLDLAKEAVASERTGHLAADFARDMHVAVRAIRRAPGFAAAVVVSLALGLGGTTAIFSVVYGVLIRPLAFDHADELHIVRVWWNDFSAPPSTADYFALRETGRSSGAVGAYFFPDTGFALAGAAGPELVEGAIITPDLLELLRVRPRLGQGFTAQQQTCEILIGETLWQRRLGGRDDAIGRTLVVDGERCAVVGVMPPRFNLPGRKNDQIWAQSQLKPPTRRGPFFLTVLARVPSEASVETVEARITTAVTPVLRDRYGVKDSWRYGLRPVRDALVGGGRGALPLTVATGSLVLIIGMAHVANLLLARGTVRARELGVRAFLGCGRGRLGRQVLPEAGGLGAAGGVFGVL